MLLDIDAATLTVWVNGERKGVMVRPGMVSRHCSEFPQKVARLDSLDSLRWVVVLSCADGDSVAIGGPLPLPA